MEKPKPWTDKQKIAYILCQLAKYAGEVGFLQGLMEAHLIQDHKYKPEAFKRKKGGVR